MRKLFGHAKNINDIIMGRVKTSCLFNFCSDEILIARTPPKYQIGFKLLLTSCKDKQLVARCQYPIVYGIEGSDELNKGDVVSVENSGQINFLFESHSDDNVLFLTERCNCCCVMCPQRISSHDNVALNMQLISLIDKKTKYLGLTGGEPTLLGRDLVEIIAKCKKELPDTSIFLLTNGILLNDLNYVKEIASVNHPSLRFQVGLYSDIDSEHNKIVGTKGFSQTINGIYNLAIFKQRIEIRTVIHRLNYERLPKLAEFIYRNFPFVVHVALMGLEVEGYASDNIDKLWVEPLNYMDALEEAVKTLHRAAVPVSIYNHQLCLLPEKLWPFSRKSISSWKNIYFEFCNECSAKNMCGGLFFSSQNKHSNHLHPLK